MGMFGSQDLDRPLDEKRERRERKAEISRQWAITRKANAEFRANKFYEKAREKGISQYNKEHPKKVPFNFQKQLSTDTRTTMSRLDRPRKGIKLPSVTSLFKQRGTQRRIYI